MRLIVARCSVEYSGRLTARLPEALRLVMLKADGSVLVHADAGGYKPLNWMTPPTVVEEEDGLIVVRKLKGEDRLDITLHEVLSDVDRLMDEDAARLEKDGVERDLQELLADLPGALRRGLPARAPRVADRHRARGPDVPRRGRRLGGGRDQARRARSTRSSSSRATWSGSGWTRRWRDCAGVLAAQVVKPQARVLAEARGMSWVEVDLAELRGEREPALTLFGS